MSPPIGEPDPRDRRAGRARASVPLGQWSGVPMTAHWSAAATLVLFAWLLADDVLPSAAPGHTHGAYWALGAVTAAVVLVTLLAHELAHAVVARRYGLRIKGITLWMLGGVTELDGDPPSPRADAWIAVAGPLVSMGVGLASGAFAWAVGGLVGAALFWLAVVNVVLGLFNLLPGAPLDGGRLLRALLWRRYGDRARAAMAAGSAGRVLGTALVALGLVVVVLGDLTGLWLALIGWFVRTGSDAERYAAGLDRLRGTTAAEIMAPVPATAPDWWTVGRLLEEPWSCRPQEAIPVVDLAGQVTGVVDPRRLYRLPPKKRDTTRLRGIAAGVAILAPTAPVADCLPVVQRGTTVVVVEAGRPLGLISPAGLGQSLLLAALRERHLHDREQHRTAA